MNYIFTEQTIKLPDNDHDIFIELPNGEIVELQWRVESTSMDICFSENRPTTIWNEGLKPAKSLGNSTFSVNQMVIGFPEEVLDKES